jgi:hypothetical protein
MLYELNRLESLSKASSIKSIIMYVPASLLSCIEYTIYSEVCVTENNRPAKLIIHIKDSRRNRINDSPNDLIAK